MQVHKTFIEHLENWDLEAHYPEEFDTPTFPEGQEIPFTLAKREYNVLGLLDYTQVTWNVTYAATNPKGKRYWAYAHQLSIQNANTPTKYCTWDQYLLDVEDPEKKGITMDAPSDFDPRYDDYSARVALTAILSEERFAETDQEREVNKTNKWLLTELSSLKVALIPDDDQLGARGKKRPASFTPGPAKGPRRQSSVPPHSDIAKAKAEAEARKELELQSEGSSKGKSKDESVQGKESASSKGKDSGKGKSFEPANRGQSKRGTTKGIGKGKPKGKTQQASELPDPGFDDGATIQEKLATIPQSHLPILSHCGI